MTPSDLDEAALTGLLREHGEFVTERLDHWARVAADRTFVFYGEDDVALSYGEFARRVDSIAGNLARLGIGRGDRVGVFTRNPLASTLMMFGIWKAGAVYSPVNFSYAGRLLAYQLNDARPKLFVTDPHLLPVLNEVAEAVEAAPLVAIYAAPPGSHDHVARAEWPSCRYAMVGWNELAADCRAPNVTLAFDDPANLVYTSGTTGPAKGVLQPHRWMATYTFGFRMLTTSEDVVYNDLPAYHVGGAIANVCRAAWVGCEVAIWDRFSPDRFWQRIASRGATTAILLDVMISWLTKAPERPDDRVNTLTKVHMQPLALQHHAFATRFGIDFVTAGFGQTESGLGMWAVIEETAEGMGTPADLYRGASHAEVHEVATRLGMTVIRGEDAARRGLMGRPAPFVEAAIRDGLDEACAPEKPGQLALRPRLPGIFMHGYLNKAEATVAAFRNLWFHTGDAAVQDKDGLFYFVDRLGDRIRVRGENLSSFQVEDMINQHPGVQMCAAVAIPSEEGDEDQVVVFAVPREGEALEEAALHAFAAETMPRYMRPSHVRIVPDLPRTPTNKVEKYKLRLQIIQNLSPRSGLAATGGSPVVHRP